MSNGDNPTRIQGSMVDLTIKDDPTKKIGPSGRTIYAQQTFEDNHISLFESIIQGLDGLDFLGLKKLDMKTKQIKLAGKKDEYDRKRRAELATTESKVLRLANLGAEQEALLNNTANRLGYGNKFYWELSDFEEDEKMFFTPYRIDEHGNMYNTLEDRDLIEKMRRQSSSYNQLIFATRR